jgi:hypothetical protein
MKTKKDVVKKVETKKADLCIRPGCNSPAKIKGLCLSDYTSAARLVKKGKTTWEELEAKGKVLPNKRGNKSKWFLE